MTSPRPIEVGDDVQVTLTGEVLSVYEKHRVDLLRVAVGPFEHSKYEVIEVRADDVTRTASATGEATVGEIVYERTEDGKIHVVRADERIHVTVKDLLVLGCNNPNIGSRADVDQEPPPFTIWDWGTSTGNRLTLIADNGTWTYWLDDFDDVTRTYVAVQTMPMWLAERRDARLGKIEARIHKLYGKLSPFREPTRQERTLAAYETAAAREGRLATERYVLRVLDWLDRGSDADDMPILPSIALRDL